MNYRTTLQCALQLAAEGDVLLAVSNLAEAIQVASREREQRWARLLLLNIVVLEERLQHYSGAKHRCQEFLRDFGNDDRVIFSLARLSALLGQADDCRAFLAVSRTLAVEGGNTELVEVIDDFATRWQ